MEAAVSDHLAGRFKSAREGYETVLAQDPNLADIHNNLALVKTQLADLSGAEVHYQRAIKLRPWYAEAYNNYGVLKRTVDEQSEAQALFSKAIEHKPKYAEAWRNLGLVLECLDEPADALEALSKAIKIKPDLIEAHQDRARVINRTDDPMRAIEVIKDSIESHPKDGRLHLELGKALLKAGQLQEAERVAQISCEMMPVSIDGWHLYARLLALKGEVRKAIDPLRKAIKIAFQRVIEKPAVVRDGNQMMAESESDHRTMRESALEALLTASRVLEQIGVESFICFGTLLGCVRHADFLKNDKDVDIGIWEGAPADKINSALSENGFVLDTAALTDGKELGEEIRLPFRYRNGITMDLFVHRKEQDRYLCGVDGEAGSLLWWFSPFRLRVMNFLGQKFMAPEDYEKYLCEAYGDWRTPDPDFIGTFDVPNIVGGYPDIAAYSAHYFASEMLVKGKYSKAIRILRFLREHEDSFDDYDLDGMIEELEARVRP